MHPPTDPHGDRHDVPGRLIVDVGKVIDVMVRHDHTLSGTDRMVKLQSVNGI